MNRRKFLDGFDFDNNGILDEIDPYGNRSSS